MNPMSEFKKSFTKEYEIQGKKFLFRSITTKEASDIEKEISKNSMLVSDDNKFNVRKIEILSIALVSVDNTLLKNFDDVQASISKGISEKESIKNEIGSWDDGFTTLLLLYYFEMTKQKDSSYKKDIEYLEKISK